MMGGGLPMMEGMPMMGFAYDGVLHRMGGLPIMGVCI